MDNVQPEEAKPETPFFVVKNTRSQIHRIKYKCLNCGEMDEGKFFQEEVDRGEVPPCINCWKCGQGRNYSKPQIYEQMQARVGMFRVIEDEDGNVADLSH